MELTPNLTAAQVMSRLELEPHPEGGFFRETFRAADVVQTARGARSLATGILFLLTRASCSRLHRLASDELWVHQAGAAVELVMLPTSGGPAEVITLAAPDMPPGCGPRPAGGCRPQAAVPAGVWQGAHLAADAGGVEWGLVACVVVPGFDCADFELGERDALLSEFPQEAELIIEFS